MKRRLVGMITAAMIGSLFSPGLATASVAAAKADSTCWNYKPSERSFARKANGARSTLLLGKLKLDPELSRVARKHTREMIKAGKLFHTPENKLRARVTNWTLLGENVGVGSSVSSLHTAFMQSPEHASNILHPGFGNQGVGVIKKNGKLWVTVMFSSPENPGTTLKMPTC